MLLLLRINHAHSTPTMQRGTAQSLYGSRVSSLVLWSLKLQKDRGTHVYVPVAQACGFHLYSYLILSHEIERKIFDSNYIFVSDHCGEYGAEAEAKALCLHTALFQSMFRLSPIGMSSVTETMKLLQSVDQMAMCV